jgi:hypothetical protein
MSLLVWKAFRKLIQFDVHLVRRDSEALYDSVRTWPIAEEVVRAHSVEEVCAAMDTACVWYWKEVLCLQRAAATTCLLKNYGVPAQLVIGAQQIPFKAHAWVEVEGRVVNDKPYIPEVYAVLTRC